MNTNVRDDYEYRKRDVDRDNNDGCLFTHINYHSSSSGSARNALTDTNISVFNFHKVR